MHGANMKILQAMFTITSSKANYVDASAHDTYLATKRMKSEYTISYVFFICNSKIILINFTSHFTFSTTFIQNPTLKCLCEIWICYEENSPPYNAAVNQRRAVRQVETSNLTGNNKRTITTFCFNIYNSL